MTITHEQEDPMSPTSFVDRKRLFTRSPILLAGIAVVCTGIALVMFYETLMRQHEAYLANEVMEQLNWIDTIGRSKNWDSQETLKEYLRCGVNHELLGETGEFEIAIQEGEKVRFLVQKAAVGSNVLRSMTDSAIGMPMRQTFEGKKGTMIGIDDHGHRVLAAFASVPRFNWGLVVKTDINEVLQPFLKSASIIVFAVMVVVVVGIPLLVRLGKPLIRELEQSQECVSLAIQRSINV
jgi:hypothetical protein